MKKKKQRKTVKTYTKKCMSAIVTISLIDLQVPFVLAFMGKDNIAETLAVAIVTEIIGVFLVYCAKSYFETKEEAKNEMKMEMMKEESNDGVDG